MSRASHTFETGPLALLQLQCARHTMTGIRRPGLAYHGKVIQQELVQLTRWFGEFGKDHGFWG